MTDNMRLQIDGMSCGHCVGTVEKALRGLDGVTVGSVTVGAAEVQLDPAKTTREAVISAVTASGYPAHASAPRS